MKYCFLVLILNLVALVLMSNLEIFPKLQVMFLPDVSDDYKTLLYLVIVTPILPME